jgi:hypothetical protein
MYLRPGPRYKPADETAIMIPVALTGVPYKKRRTPLALTPL